MLGTEPSQARSNSVTTSHDPVGLARRRQGLEERDQILDFDGARSSGFSTRSPSACRRPR
jgi:hypothetical protein